MMGINPFRYQHIIVDRGKVDEYTRHRLTGSEKVKQSSLILL